jgi:hypothetical protein
MGEKFGRKMLRKKNRRPRLKWKSAINMCCKEMDCESVDLINVTEVN